MSTATKLFIGLFLGLLVLLGVTTWRLASREHELDALKLAPAKAAAAIAQAKVETVTVRLAAAESVVTREITRVRTDTLVLRPQSRQDTVIALTQLPALAAAHDSLKASCSAFVVSCTDFRTAAEQRDTARLVVIAGLEAQLRANTPGRLEAAWNKIKLPLAFGLGLYAGLQAH